MIETYQETTRLVDELATCPYTSDALSNVLDNVQKIVSRFQALHLMIGFLKAIFGVQIDRMNLEGYANLDPWVAELDKRIETILLDRLRQIIDVWCAEFSKTEDSDFKREVSSLVDSKRKVGFVGEAGKVRSFFHSLWVATPSY